MVNTPLVNWSMDLEAAVEKCNVSANIIKNEVTLTPFHIQFTMISLALISFKAEHWLVRYIWKSTFIALFLLVYTLMLYGVRLAFTLYTDIINYIISSSSTT